MSPLNRYTTLFCAKNKSLQQPNKKYQTNTQKRSLIGKTVFSLPFRTTLDSKLREFQYKILNNIVFTNDKLFRFGLSQSPNIYPQHIAFQNKYRTDIIYNQGPFVHASQVNPFNTFNSAISQNTQVPTCVFFPAAYFFLINGPVIFLTRFFQLQSNAKRKTEGKSSKYITQNPAVTIKVQN